MVEEVRLGRPVPYRSMFSKERSLGRLKSNVKNRCQPEGCIAEAYLADECLIFCSRYLRDDASSKLNIPTKNSDDSNACATDESSIFQNIGCPIGIKKKNRGKKWSLDERTYTQALVTCYSIVTRLMTIFVNNKISPMLNVSEVNGASGLEHKGTFKILWIIE